VFAAIGGAMFTLQVGFMSPTLVGIVPSIEMVIFCAVGGRMSIIGAVYGALLVNWAKSSLSESFPELWLFALGGLFIAVVMAFPNGLAGLYTTYVAPKIKQWAADFKTRKENQVVAKTEPVTVSVSKPAAKIDTSGNLGSSPLTPGVLHE
jgi:urea transport system permease protein